MKSEKLIKISKKSRKSMACLLLHTPSLSHPLCHNPFTKKTNPKSSHPPNSQISPNLAMEVEAKQLLTEMFEPQKREQALLHLSRKKETIPGLAILLWKTPGLVALLIQEIIKIYPYLSPPTLSSGDSTRVCYALSLFQCIASEPSLRSKLLNAQILHYIYPLLSTDTSLLEFEHLRITSLGVIGAILKGGTDMETIVHLLENEFVPLCLRSIDKGTQTSKAVATFILEKILITDIGLKYVCSTADRFFCIHQILKSMVASSHEKPSVRLLRHVIRCYLRLSHHARAREVLRQELPIALKDGTFNELLQVEDLTRVALVQLLDNTGNNGQCSCSEPAGRCEQVDCA